MVAARSTGRKLLGRVQGRDMERTSCMFSGGVVLGVGAWLPAVTARSACTATGLRAKQ